MCDRSSNCSFYLLCHCLILNVSFLIRVNCPCPEQGRTRPKSEQSTFEYNICFDSTHRTSRSQSNHSQEPCEWFGHDLQVLFIKLEHKLHLKVEVDCSDFGPVRDRGSVSGQLFVWTNFCPSYFFLIKIRFFN